MAPRTEAQQKALDVLKIDGSAFVSNQTNRAGHLVYWQTARWLVSSGFATKAGWEHGQEKLVITAAGRAA